MSFRIFLSLIFLLSLTACVSVEDKTRLYSSHYSSHYSGELPPENTAACTLQSADTTIGGRALDPGSISLLNWNIYKGDGKNWQPDLDAYAAGHDIITLQEARLREELIDTLKRYAQEWTINTAFYIDEQATGVMTVSTSPVLHSCGYKTTEPLIRIPKSTLVSYYAIEGSEDKLLVANIHGINFTLGMAAYEQQLDELYRAIRHHRGPMIVAGDFNSWSEKRMAAVTRFRNDLRLSALEYRVNNKTHLFGNAIDHVFYRGLEPLNKKVWQVSSSDHNPISVNFRLLTAVDETILVRAGGE